jgi:hypothetical protein
LIETSKGTSQLLAIRALSADDDFDNVPYFIFALASADRQNVLAARDALVRLRRTFRTVGPPDQYSERQRRDAIRQWKEWYLSADPNARLLRLTGRPARPLRPAAEAASMIPPLPVRPDGGKY